MIPDGESEGPAPFDILVNDDAEPDGSTEHDAPDGASDPQPAS